MFKKFIRWLMKFHYRREVQQLIMQYKKASSSTDRTVWIAGYFNAQDKFLNSAALNDLYVNSLPSAPVYIYNDIESTKKIFEQFLSQLVNNAAINTNLLGEFMQNSQSSSIHTVFKEDVDIKEQLLEINKILKQVLAAYEKQTGSFKTMNLPRIIAMFEMFAIIVNRVAEGYLTTE